jgi:integrase/recombinase XerD
MPAVVSLILDTRRMKIKTGKYPVKLQVSFERTTLHYQTIFDLTKDEYSKLSAPRIGSSLLDIRDRLKSLNREAEDYIKDVSSFSFYEFERDFITAHELFKRRQKLRAPEPDQKNVQYTFDYSPYLRRFSIFSEDHSKPGTISIVYFSVIKRLIEGQRIGTALSYQDSYNSFKKFRGNVCFTDITIGYLNQYEQWMKARGVSKTTIGIKIRPLRTMFNEAFEMGIIKRDKCYPFGRRKYRIPTGRNIKKAIGQDFIKQLYYDKPLSLSESKAKDFWLFCYFGNGMNPKDVVHLKFRDIQDGYIVFIRHKTERTTRNDPKPITVYITGDLQNIIDKWEIKINLLMTIFFPLWMTA